MQICFRFRAKFILHSTNHLWTVSFTDERDSPVLVWRRSPSECTLPAYLCSGLPVSVFLTGQFNTEFSYRKRAWLVSDSDGHELCLVCLGIDHARAALVGGSYSHCGNKTIARLIELARVPSFTPWSTSFSLDLELVLWLVARVTWGWPVTMPVSVQGI